jgi:hypothetical protein
MPARCCWILEVIVPRRGWIEICCEIKRITDKAVCINDGDDDVWLPLSQVEFDGDVSEGDTMTIEVKEWIAEREGLV